MALGSDSIALIKQWAVALMLPGYTGRQGKKMQDRGRGYGLIRSLIFNWIGYQGVSAAVFAGTTKVITAWSRGG